jgi:hypothetical protein
MLEGSAANDVDAVLRSRVCLRERTSAAVVIGLFVVRREL